jgi:hypothetical protein
MKVESILLGEFDDNREFKMSPNFSKDLKRQLRQLRQLRRMERDEATQKASGDGRAELAPIDTK